MTAADISRRAEALPESGESSFISAPDGLMLHVRSYGPRLVPYMPVICLAGLTRTSADFDELAAALASDPVAPRRVHALDYRGRGQSGYDKNWRNYTLATELADLIAVLTALDVGRAIFVGTSRGGLLTMLLATARPGAIAGAVLNDIGPVIDLTGLLRIKSYTGKLPRPKDFDDAAEILRRLFSQHFSALHQADWQAFARRAFKEDKLGLSPTYDVALAKTLAGITADRPPAPLWAEFDALSRVPLLVLRGENSDLLSAATVEAMRARRSAMETMIVPGQGHPPVLSGQVNARIARFIAGCEGVGTA